MERRAFDAPGKLAPPIGVYSRAIRVGDLLFISGHCALDRDGNVVGAGDAGAQAEQILRNIGVLLEEAGATLDKVVKATTYLVDIADFPKVTEAKKKFFRAPYPTWTTVAVTALARPEFLVEIDAIAVL